MAHGQSRPGNPGFLCLQRWTNQPPDEPPSHAAIFQRSPRCPRQSVSRHTPTRWPRASRDHQEPPHDGHHGQHFPGIFASRNPRLPWESWCVDSLHACARSSHERISRPCASERPGQESPAVSVHEACIGIPSQTGKNAASAPGGCSCRECSTSCGCVVGWLEHAWTWLHVICLLERQRVGYTAEPICESRCLGS